MMTTAIVDYSSLEFIFRVLSGFMAAFSIGVLGATIPAYVATYYRWGERELEA